MDTVQILVDMRATGREEVRRLANEQAALTAKIHGLESGLNRMGRASVAAGNNLKGLQAQLASVDRELARAAAQAERADRALSRVGGARFNGKLLGNVALAGANIAQDVAQAGPGAAVNNVLGIAPQLMAVEGGFKAVGAAALKAATGPLGVFVAVAGAGLGALNAGLKSANLGWSDLDDVIANTKIAKAVGETVSGLDQILGVSEAVSTAWEAIRDGVHDLADVALGWDEATEAVGRHKAEVEEVERRIKAAAEAEKSLAKVQSAAQKDRAEAGKNAIQAVAELGGAGGLDAVREKLVGAALGASDPNATVSRAGIEKTARQWAEIDANALLGGAGGGDPGDVAALAARLKAAGLDAGQVTAAANAPQAERDAEAARIRGRMLAHSEANQGYVNQDAAQILSRSERVPATEEGLKTLKRMADEFKDAVDAAKKAQDDLDSRADEMGGPLADAYAYKRATGGSPDAAWVSERLNATGLADGPEEAASMASAVLSKLDESYRETIGKIAARDGLDFKGAEAKYAGDEAAKAAEKANREADEARRKAVGRAEALTAGTDLDGRIEETVMLGLLSGKGGAQARAGAAKTLSDELAGLGMSPEDSRAAAEELVGERYGRLMDRIAAGAAAGSGPGAAGKVDVVRAEDWARQVQTGMAPQEKILNATRNMEAHLQELVRQGRLRPVAIVG